MDAFSEVLFRFQDGRAVFEDRLLAVGFHDFERLWGDEYDNSIEFGGVGNDVRLTPDQQKVIFDAGFSTAFVNHKDGWETHYNWKLREFVVSRGWRRRWVEDSAASTTRSIGVAANESNSGYYEISYWPDSWGTHDWRETGYMRIVPDPLEPPAAPPRGEHD